METIGTVTTVGGTGKRYVSTCEFIGMVFIIVLGSLCHFTFEWSGGNWAVATSSEANESAWEH